MMRKRVTIAVEAVPSDYDPGYPEHLSKSDYDALVLRPLRRRLLGIAAAAGLGLGGASSASGQDPGREQAVLGVVDGLLRSHAKRTWLPRATAVRTCPQGLPDDVTVVVPAIPIMFGNSFVGLFDADAARRRARRLFEAYGYDMRSPVPLERGGETTAVIDGLDEKRRVGFEIREGLRTQLTGWARTAKGEDAAAFVDREDYDEMVRRGWKMHVTDRSSYPIMDHDAVTPALAHLISVVDFLNGVTDGPDVDLMALMNGWDQRLEATGVKTTHHPEKRTRHVVLAFNGGEPSAAMIHSSDAWHVLDQPMSTAGRVTELHLDEKRHESFTVVQRAVEPPLEVAGRGSRVLLPSRFDAARPFEIRIDLPIDDEIDDRVTVKTLPH